MNAISLHRLKKALRAGFVSSVAVLATYGQTTQVNLATQGRNVDFTGAPSTKPIKTGTALPATCQLGEFFFKTNAVSGQNLFGCTAANTWTLLSAAAVAALGDPGANGLVVRTAANTTSAVTAPSGTVVGTTDTQTLTNKSIDASEITSGTLNAARVPTLNQNTTGNAATATVLAATPTVCPPGQAATGILANGNATGCAAMTGGSGGATTPATTNVLVGTGTANGVAAGVPNVDYLAPVSPVITGMPTINGNTIGAFRVTSLPSSCVVGTDPSVLFASGGTDALYTCDNTGHYTIAPGGSTTLLGGDVTGVGSANTVSKIGGIPVGNLATQSAPAAGVVISDGTILSSKAAPTGDLVGSTDTQTLTNKSIDASEITGGTLTAARVPTLNQNTTGNSATATALAATPTVCPAGQAATGILANGNATGCAAMTGGSGGGATTPATTNVLVGTGVANGVAAGVPNVDYLAPASPTMTGTPTVNGNKIGAFRVAALPSSCVAGTDPSVVFASGGTDAVYTCDSTGHYAIPPGGSTTVLGGDVTGAGSANTVSKIGGVPVGNLATQSAPAAGIVTSDGTAIGSKAAPAGAIVGATDTQTLTNKSIDASEITSGTLSSSTLPAVNTTPGTFGDATHSAQVTVDATGRITAVSQFPVAATAGLGDPGSNGLVVRTATNVTTAVAPPAGDLVGTTETQSLTNKSIDASEIISGTLAAARVPTLNQNTTGNAATATALASAPALCPTGQAPTGILANGSATGCAAINGGSGGAPTPATTNVLVGTGVANGVAAGVPNIDYLAPANPAMTGTPTVNGNKIGAFRVTALPSSCVAGTDSSVVFASGGTDAVYTCDSTGHYAIPPGGSTTVLAGDVTGVGSANTVSKIGGVPVGSLATQNVPAAGVVTSDGTNLASQAAPASAIVGATDTQTLTNKSIDASEINSGTLSTGRLPAFSGDIVTAAGSAIATLPVVNTTPGTFGDGTHSAQVTVDAKGRITSVSDVPVAPNGLGDPGSNGLVIRTAANVTSAVAAPVGAVVGTTDTQTLTNKSIDGSEISSGTIAAARIPVLNQNTTGNASTATALAVDPSQCTGQFATGIAANGNANCAMVAAVLGYTAQNAATANAHNDALGAAAAAQTSAQAFAANASNISSGTIAAARIPVLNQNTAGNAATATALAAAPSLCPSGQAPTGILANGNATGCSVSGGSGLQPPPAAGIVTGTSGSTVTGSIPAPTGAVVGTTDTQVLSHKDLTASTNTFPSFPVSQITGLGNLAVQSAPSTGIVTSDGTNLSSIAIPASALVGISDTQTLTNKSIDASEINSGTLSANRLPAFSGDVLTAAGSTAANLSTVNANPGTFGDSTHTLQVTVDAKGRITALSLIAVSGAGGGSIASGTLSSLPAACALGTLYFVTDQPAGQQLYTCSATNVWTQLVNLGGSGALLFSGGSLDINPAVVPTLTGANTFSGLTTASNGLSLLTPNTQPACSSSIRGTFWYLNNGSAKDSIQVCVYTGSAFAWTSLY